MILRLLIREIRKRPSAFDMLVPSIRQQIKHALYASWIATVQCVCESGARSLARHVVDIRVLGWRAPEYSPKIVAAAR